MMNVPLVLVVLGLIAELAMPMTMVRARHRRLPIIGER